MRVDLERADTGGVTLDLEEHPERLRPRPVRRRSARLPATAPHHVSVECGGLASELLGQPSLADTRFAPQQHDAAPARHGVFQSPQHDVELAVAANEEAGGGLVSAAARSLEVAWLFRSRHPRPLLPLIYQERRARPVLGASRPAQRCAPCAKLSRA